MKMDEKICPMCAETIKKAALVCKHCGHRFPEREMKPKLDAPENNGKGGKWGCAIVVVALIGLASLAGGDDEPAGNSKDGGSSAEDPLADVGSQQVWIVKSHDGIRARLKDPDSAEFRNSRFYSGGPSPAVCGEVNAKNGFGGFTGFERFIASGEDTAFVASDSTPSEFQTAWDQLCVRADRDEAYVP